MPPQADDGLPVVWHFTFGNALRAIVCDGVIKPSHRPNEKPAVWFSAAEDWEPGASLGLRGAPGVAEIMATADRLRAERGEDAARAYVLDAAREIGPGLTGGFLGRIGVTEDVAPFTWEDFKRMSMSGPQGLVYFDAVEAWDREVGADNRLWRVSLEPVPAEKWIAVEVRSSATGWRWEPVAF